MVSKIVDDRLFLGDIDDARHADEYAVNFDRVITVGPENPTDFTTDHFVLPDAGPDWDKDKHYPRFRAAVNTLRGAMHNGETTLVHCHAGQSRSPMVTVAAMATLDGTSFTTAYTEVRSKRSIVNPTEELRWCATKYITTYQIDNVGE